MRSFATFSDNDSLMSLDFASKIFAYDIFQEEDKIDKVASQSSVALMFFL